jgi:hypothetical protein
MLKLTIKVLGCGCVTLILITKNASFLLRVTKCDILVKHINLETVPCFWSLSFFQQSVQKANLTKLHLFPSSDHTVRDPSTDTLERTDLKCLEKSLRLNQGNIHYTYKLDLYLRVIFGGEQKSKYWCDMPLI